jgi:hypothetical protein
MEIQRYPDTGFKEAAAFKCFRETRHAAEGTTRQVPQAFWKYWIEF